MKKQPKKQQQEPRPPPKPTVIVSGFARTGTTAMMRILEAGGVSVLADRHTKKDIGAYHAHGLYEMLNVCERMKKRSPAWTAGKALKVATPFIPAMPLDRDYKVVFMVRNVHEIITSLLAYKVIWEEDPVTSIGNARKILDENDIPVFDVPYADMVKYPRATVKGIAEFLDRPLDVDAMAGIIDAKAREKAFKKHSHREQVLSFDKDDLIHRRAAV